MSEPIITQAELDELREEAEALSPGGSEYPIFAPSLLALLDLIAKQREALEAINARQISAANEDDCDKAFDDIETLAHAALALVKPNG